MSANAARRRIAVMGTGSWGTAFSQVLADAGHEVRLWGRRAELVRAIRATRSNPDYLPDLSLPDAVIATADAAEALDRVDLVVLAIPSQVTRGTVRPWASLVPADATVLSLAKGVERTANARMSQVAAEVIGAESGRIAVLSGPNLSHEVAARQPAGCVVASEDARTARDVAEAVRTDYFRTEATTDVVGVEIGGATKNVVAVVVGVAQGLGLGDNTRASLITRGLAETSRLAAALGGRPGTMEGLAGVGDLIATCMSPLSRNLSAGIALGQGTSLQDVVDGTLQTAEGVRSAEAILALAQMSCVDMPLVEAVVAVVQDGQQPGLVAMTLMSRELKSEKS